MTARWSNAAVSLVVAAEAARDRTKFQHRGGGSKTTASIRTAEKEKCAVVAPAQLFQNQARGQGLAG